MSKWKRYRFNTYATQDCRPIIFNPKYAWWCTGYGEDGGGGYCTIVAYLPYNEDLSRYWDDASNVEYTEEENIEFSSRFPKPNYFVD